MSSLYAMPKNLVLAASAGTGKTHALVGVVVHLVVCDRLSLDAPLSRPPVEGKRRPRVSKPEPIDPSRIVATTFSRKAAAEIRARVNEELDRLANTPDASFYFPSLVATQTERSGKATSAAEIGKRARRALARLPQARFGTIHSFATGIVREYAIEVGLGPGFDLATEAESRARDEDAIARALERRLLAEPEAIRGLAEAAGGVDRLVSSLRRVLGQLEEDGRSAKDLVLAEGDVVAVEATMQTFVHHAEALLGEAKFAEAARAVSEAFGAHDEARLEGAVVALSSIAALGKKSPNVSDFAVFRAGLPGATNDERGRRLVRAYRGRHLFASHAALVRDVVAEAEAEIERIGRSRASLGFSEILRAARALLLGRPDVADEISAGIDALLVDEVQDTSRVQSDLLKLLWAREGTREAGKVPGFDVARETGLLVVGDRKQSIYGFRGADVGVFAELAVGLAGAPAREALGIPPGVAWEPKAPLADFHALRHNRRSVTAILGFANAFSAKRFRPGDPPPQLFEVDYVPATEDLLVPPERPASGEEVIPQTTWLRITPKARTSSRLDEALVASARIQRLVAEGEATYRDIAVLATTNGMLDAVAFALAQANVPYVVAGKSFFRTREVRDMAAILALVLEPTDRRAILEVLRGPWAAVHDETLLGLVAREGGGLSPPSVWSDPPRPELVRPEDRASLAAVAKVVSALHRCVGRVGPSVVLREACEALALEAVLALLPRGEQRVANVRKLFAIADRHADARSFRTWLDDATEQELAESEAATFSDEDDAVRLLTIHASKGLDFPIVFVPEIGAGLPRTERGVAAVALGPGDEPNVLSVRVTDPSGFVIEPPSYTRAYTLARRRERAERQRLAYVAMTRAAKRMFLVGGRASEAPSDPGTSSLAVIEELAAANSPTLVVEDAEVPAPVVAMLDDALHSGDAEAPRARVADAGARRGAATSDATAGGADGDGERVRSRRSLALVAPAWRSLPIAPTALSDFAHCARRFELVHVLGLPEHVRGARTADVERSSVGLDARAQGTLAHAVLERVTRSAFGSPDAQEIASAALVAAGVPETHAAHAPIVARATRFLVSDYARAIDDVSAAVHREVGFVLDVPDAEGRSVSLRGSMDLVVVFPDGSVDVVDYKSARSGKTDTYAFQLDVYALAARAVWPDAPRLRAGLVFLGGGSGEPIWRDRPSDDAIRARLAALGNDVVEARWTGSFPRVGLDRCEAIYCGFIGRCHAEHARAMIAAKSERKSEVPLPEPIVVPDEDFFDPGSYDDNASLDALLEADDVPLEDGDFTAPVSS